MNEIYHFRVVHQALGQQGSQNQKATKIKKEDWIAAVILLTNIAVKTIEKNAALQAPKSADQRFSLDPMQEFTDKIQSFVKYNSSVFRKACQTGFPFFTLKSFSTEKVLENYLDQEGSLLFHFMKLHDFDEIDQEEFRQAIQQLKISEIAKTCTEFKDAYRKEKNNTAGYNLLWLLKQVGGCDYEIPAKASFDSTTVAKLLSHFINNSGFLKNPINFIEIMHYRKNRLSAFLYQKVLDQQAYPIFLNFSVEQLSSIPIERWPHKIPILINLFETFNFDSKLTMAKVLASSQDEKTAKIGHHVGAALSAASIRETILHFNSLVELIPHLNETHFRVIFECPWLEFCYDNSIDYKKDPDFTKRLHFNKLRKVFVEQGLMIGIYETRVTSNGHEILPYLLAYDLKTEQLVWEVPLNKTFLNAPSSRTKVTFQKQDCSEKSSNDYRLKRVGKNLSIQFSQEKELYLIDPKTGNLQSSMELPGILNDTYDFLHITPEGFAYQLNKIKQGYQLIGGKIVDHQWSSLFESDNPHGFFRPLSTHCGFQHPDKDELILFGPTGHSVTISGCRRAKAQQDKLYSIEKDPSDQDKCLLTIRTLKIDHEVVSPIENSIQLEVKNAAFGDFCQNGQLILFVGDWLALLPVFIDLKSQQVTYSPHQFPDHAKRLINTDSGELWTWDQLSNNVWKVSATAITEMGVLESGRGTTLLHVDTEDHLYFVNISY